jgi:hypothetical protein
MARYASDKEQVTIVPHHQLDAIIRDLTVLGRGILAAGRSSGTIEQRYKGMKIHCTEGTRRQLRESSKWKPLDTARN